MLRFFGVLTEEIKRELAKPDGVIQIVPPFDPVAAFNARREAKRKSEHEWDSTPDVLFSKRLCKHCGLNGADIRDAIKCDGSKAIKMRPALARAMRTPAPHEGDINERLMPWRGARP